MLSAVAAYWGLVLGDGSAAVDKACRAHFCRSLFFAASVNTFAKLQVSSSRLSLRFPAKACE